MYTKLFRVQLTEFPHTLLYIFTLRQRMAALHNREEAEAAL